MTERIIKIEKAWLHLPIGTHAPRHYIHFDVDGEQFTEMNLGLQSENPDFYGAMEVTELLGRELRIWAEEDLPESYFDGILPGGPMEEEPELYADVYQEPLRQHYHFAPRRGWLNDPNGLVFDGEHYHMFFQHNPFANYHGDGDIHWGHAVSTDAVHWQERRDAIRPWVSQRHIASGSCIIDREGVAGYGKGAMIAAFTHLGSKNYRGNKEWLPSEGQFMAYSTDGGEHFTFFPGNPRVPTENGKSWRDPRLFYLPEGGFGMAVYETFEEKNCVAFYRSDDLHNWQRTARADDLFECPDLFPLVSDKGQTRWILYGADSMYRLGDFVNGAFHQQGDRFPMDFGSSTYAGQTWSERDDSDGRLHISWLQDELFTWEEQNSFFRSGPVSQSMTVPCLLTLHETPRGYRLHRNPLPAIESLRTGEHRAEKVCGVTEYTPDLFLHGDSRLIIRPRGPVQVRVGRHGFTYDPAEGIADWGKRPPYILEKNGDLDLRVLTDTASCEFFLQQEVSATYGPDMRVSQVSLSCEAGMDVEMTTHELGKFWERQ